MRAARGSAAPAAESAISLVMHEVAESDEFGYKVPSKLMFGGRVIVVLAQLRAYSA